MDGHILLRFEAQTRIADAAVLLLPPGHTFDFCGTQMTVILHKLCRPEENCLFKIKCNYLDIRGLVQEHWLPSNEFPLSKWLGQSRIEASLGALRMGPGPE